MGTEIQKNVPEKALLTPEKGINAGLDPKLSEASLTLQSALGYCDTMTKTCMSNGAEDVRIHTKAVESRKMEIAAVSA